MRQFSVYLLYIHYFYPNILHLQICVCFWTANTLNKHTAFIFEDQEVLGEFFHDSLTPEDKKRMFPRSTGSQ
jgi:hypothetical protein